MRADFLLDILTELWYNTSSTLCAGIGDGIVQKEKEPLINDSTSERIINIVENIVLTSGAEGITVRQVLKELNATNRVFYNRFTCIDEVLDIIYNRTAEKMRESILNFDPNGDFFVQINNIVENTLLLSYDTKRNFSNYVFKNDSTNTQNYEWWTREIKKLLRFGIDGGYFKRLDADCMSYAIWCFIRGYNADAISRNLPREETAENFKYCFGVLLDGMKA